MTKLSGHSADKILYSYITSLALPRFEVLYQARKISGYVFVCKWYWSWYWI